MLNARAHRLLLALALLAIPSTAHAASLSSIPDTTYVTDNHVNAIVRSGNTIYIGGDFTHVGPRTGSEVSLSTTTGQFDAGMPQVSGAGGSVYAIAPDGAGGYFIGGSFTHVGSVARTDLAHILANRTVDPGFDAGIGGNQPFVDTIAVLGSTVYIGGIFSSVNGGTARNYAAALDATTGTATSWDPEPSNPVTALAASGSTVYIGGDFMMLGGVPRTYLAAVDATSAAIHAGFPVANSGISGLALSGSTLYVVGGFGGAGSIGGQTRNYAAAIDTKTSKVTGWNPNPNTGVLAVAVSPDGKTVYLAGNFVTVGMTPIARNHLAAVDATNGAATNWDPEPDNTVSAITTSPDGSIVYVGGYFSTVGGQQRGYLAALDAASGSATTWDPEPNGVVNALSATSSAVEAGGQFESVNGVVRNHVAALNATTGIVTSWDPNIGDWVNALALSPDGSTVYIGGRFSGANAVNGTLTRNYAAAVSATAGTATAWDPNANGYVDALAVSPDGSTVYLGGEFSGPNSLNGTLTRNDIAAVNGTTGTATSWDANLNGYVYTLLLSGGTLYAGGEFTLVNNKTVTRDHVAAFRTSDGVVTGWNPNADSTVRALALSPDGSTVYLGGDFSGSNSINGTLTRDHAAAVDATGGTATSWDPNLDSTVNALAVSGSTVYIGGAFGMINGTVTRNDITAVDATTAAVNSWNPGAGSQVLAVEVDGAGDVAIGGDFSTLDQAAQDGFALFTLPTITPPPGCTSNCTPPPGCTSNCPTAHVAPVLTSVGESNRTWRTANRLAVAARKRHHKHKAPVGTTFSYTLNEAASVSLTFTEKVPARCPASRKRKHHHGHCQRLETATLVVTAHAGANSLKFYGKVSGSTRLAPGRVTVAIKATNSFGQSSSTASLTFKIVK